MIDHIYFMLDVQAWEIKIGRAIDVRRRLSEVASSRPGHDIVLLGDIPYESSIGDPQRQRPSDRETAIHDRFNAFRIGKSEWFAATGELFDYIASRRQNGLFEGLVDVQDLPASLQAYAVGRQQVWVEISEPRE